MKFTSIIFALTAIVCLVAAKSDISETKDYHNERNTLEMDYEYKPMDIGENISNVQNRLPWIQIYFLIRDTLSTIKGVKCTVKEVDKIKAATETYLKEIQKCDDIYNFKVLELTKISGDIFLKSNDIIQLNEDICGGTKSIFTKLPDIKTPVECFLKLLLGTTTLQKQISYAVVLIDLISNTSNESNECAATAVNNLGTVLSPFPYNLKSCSKVLP